MDSWEEDFWEEPENQWVTSPEPHCRVCAAQTKDSWWGNDVLTHILPHPPEWERPKLPSIFLSDESYARRRTNLDTDNSIDRTDEDRAAVTSPYCRLCGVCRYIGHQWWCRHRSGA